MWHTIYDENSSIISTAKKYRHNPTELKHVIVKFPLVESEYPYKMAVQLLMNICQRTKFRDILWVFCNSSTPKASVCLTLAVLEQKYLLRGEV